MFVNPESATALSDSMFADEKPWLLIFHPVAEGGHSSRAANIQ